MGDVQMNVIGKHCDVCGEFCKDPVEECGMDVCNGCLGIYRPAEQQTR